MTKPLDGILVVSLEQAVAAPLASSRLAAAGARVIKVERPEGDFARGYDRAANGISSYFAWLNQDKESIALDLTVAEDKTMMTALVAKADVFIQNLAVGATSRLGLGATELRMRDPHLIVCDISGYGSDGPYADMKAYDLLVQAESGLLSVSGAPGQYGRIGVSVVDIATGMNATIGITQAIVRQQRTGEGAHVETSLFESMADWMTVPLLHHDYLGAAPERIGLAHPTIAPYGEFKTADGTSVLIAVQSDREWRTLCLEVINRPDLAEDVQFATNDARVRNRAETDRTVSEVFRATRKQELARRLKAARIAFGNVNDVAGLSTHPQLRRIEAHHADGLVSLPAPAVRADWQQADSDRRVPVINEHGDALRREFQT